MLSRSEPSCTMELKKTHKAGRSADAKKPKQHNYRCSMKKLILVRAGDTAWEEDKRLQGTVPLPLSDQGKQALQQTAQEISAEQGEVLYSSGNESSGATAEYLSQLCGVKTKKIPMFREVDCGLWQGLSIDELKKRYGRAYKLWRSDPTSITPPEGECVTEALMRIQRALETLRRKNNSKNVILVAAPLAAALVECAIGERDLADFWEIVDRPKNAQIFEFEEAGTKLVQPVKV